MTLVVRTDRYPEVPPDALRVKRGGSWIGLPDQLPRCYLELRDPPRAGPKHLPKPGARAPADDPKQVRKWRTALRAHLNAIVVSQSAMWRALLAQPTVTLVCYCRSPPCARFVVAEYLAEQGALVDKEHFK